MKKHLLTLGVVISFATIGYGQDQSVNGTLKAHALKLSDYLHIADGNNWDTTRYTHLKDRTFLYSGGGRKGMFISSYGSLADIRLQTGANWLDNPNNSLILTNQGRVGIGTITPNSKLTLKDGGQQIEFLDGTNTSGYRLFIGLNDDGINFRTNSTIRGFHFLNSQGTLLKLKENGNVGIGTTTPNSKLTLKDGGQQIEFLDGTNTSGYRLFIGLNDDGINFRTNSAIRGFHFLNSQGTLLKLKENGNVGIGTDSPDQKLTVKGVIHAQEVQVDLAGAVAPDYVFEKYYEGTSRLKADYTMPTLEEVAQFTKEHKHLPNIPSAQELEENGMHLKEMTRLLLQKIEELTLYTIEQQKEIRVLKTEIMKLKSNNE